MPIGAEIVVGKLCIRDQFTTHRLLFIKFILSAAAAAVAGQWTQHS